MSRDSIVFDTSVVVAMVVVLALLLVFASELADLSNWSQSAVDAVELGIEASLMLLIFAFVYRSQNHFHNTVRSYWGRRESVILALLIVPTFTVSQWELPMRDPLLSLYFVFSILLLFNAVAPYMEPVAERLNDRYGMEVSVDES